MYELCFSINNVDKQVMSVRIQDLIDYLYIVVMEYLDTGYLTVVYSFIYVFRLD